MEHVNSYDPDAKVPKLGSRWVWEINKPSARAVIQVEGIIWNGEEWWVRTRSLLGDAYRFTPAWSNVCLNDLGRFWEAVTPIGGSITARLYDRRAVVAGTEAHWGGLAPVAS